MAEDKKVKETVIGEGRIKREYVREDGYKVEEFVDKFGTVRSFPGYLGYHVPYYLNDPEEMSKYIEEEKENLKKYIIMCRHFTAEEIATKMVAEGVKKGSFNLSDKKHISWKLEDLKRLVLADKEKYKGITDEELDEYVDLVVHTDLLYELLDIRADENQLWAYKNISKSYQGKRVYTIKNIEEIKKEYIEDRNEARNDLKKMVLLISGLEGLLLTGVGVVMSATSGIFTIDMLLRTILLGGIGFAFGCGFLTVLLGGPFLLKFLVKKLQDKKFVEELKNNGTYEMALEYVEKLKKMEELEKKEGKTK